MAVKHKKTGLTLVEMLVVLGIIALLAGLLLPAMTVVKNTAKEAKQKAQFSSINLGLVAFKNDYGDYPSSDCPLINAGSDYSGSQKLAEALLGWDLLGFHPKSDFMSDGSTKADVFIYDATNQVFLDQRKDLYLDRETANAFRIGDNQSTANYTGLFRRKAVQNEGLAPDTYVLSDVFNKRKVILPDGSRVNAGTPILYYKANTSMKTVYDIYEELDNEKIVLLNEIQEDNTRIEQPLGLPGNNYKYFYDYITDPKTLNTVHQPYRPDSYILISAGLDGIYGTADDIRNFGN